MSPVAIGPIPNPAGIASLAFAAITSAANIAKIASSKYEGGASSSSAPTAPSVSAPSIPSVESFMPTETGNTLTDGLEGSGTEPAKVVILQSDLQNANNEAINTDVISGWG